MPEHPLSRGGLCAVGQALPLGLYDSHRLAHPLQHGEPADWTDVDQAIRPAAGRDRAERRCGSIRDVDRHQPDAAGIDRSVPRAIRTTPGTSRSMPSAVRPSSMRTSGRTASRVLPHYRSRCSARSSSRSVPTFWERGSRRSSSRRPGGRAACRRPNSPEMSYHVQFEGRMSLTGSNADRRIRLAPDEYGGVLSHLYCPTGQAGGESVDIAAGWRRRRSPKTSCTALADRLWDARGESLVLCDSQDVAVQVLVNAINHLLGNYGKTRRHRRPSRQRQGNDGDVLELVEELKSGKVSALVRRRHRPDAQPAGPRRAGGGDRQGAAGRQLCRSAMDDFASLAHFVCPDHHPLESWLDAEPVERTRQPVAADACSRWATRVRCWRVWPAGPGDDESAYDMLRGHLGGADLSARRADATGRFSTFWDQAVHDGFVRSADRHGRRRASSRRMRSTDAGQRPPHGDYCLALYSKVGLTGQPARTQSVAAGTSRPGHEGDLGQLCLRLAGDGRRTGAVRRRRRARRSPQTARQRRTAGRWFNRASTTACWRSRSATASQGTDRFAEHRPAVAGSAADRGRRASSSARTRPASSNCATARCSTCAAMSR